MTDPVRSQYESYPYPPRDPADESRRLISGSPSHLLEINHYIFAGRRDFAQPFSALVAGGGTGDATIMMAQQLADIGANATVVHLDISEASLDVARARAAARGLTNVAFVAGAIESLPELGLGPFDYIDACGVLHHLEDPQAGLAALNRVLADDGGMGVMVYAPLGRTGVYHTQAMIGLLAGDTGDAARIDIARRLLDDLPGTNWLKRNPFIGDHKTLGDAGIYDLLLHSRDRAFSVADIAELAAAGAMRLVTFIDPLRYEPNIYLKDPVLAGRVGDLPWIQRCAFAELLCGNMKTHIFYAVKAANTATTTAAPNGPESVPVLRDLDGPAAARSMEEDRRFTIDIEGLKMNSGLPDMAPDIVALIDGVRSLGAIHSEIAARADSPLAWEAFLDQFHLLYVTLNGFSQLFLMRPPAAAP